MQYHGWLERLLQNICFILSLTGVHLKDGMMGEGGEEAVKQNGVFLWG